MLEGIDGAGKSTQLARLAERIAASGRRVVRLVEPTDGPHGRQIRERARHGPPLAPREELELFLADRRENVRDNVLPALERGDVVVQDRYYLSTAAYQAARPELGLAPEDVVRLHEWAPVPDLVLLLDLPVDEGLGRVGRRGAEDAFEDASLLARVRTNFLALAAHDPTIQRVDAGAAPDAVAAAIWERVAPLLEDDEERP